MEASDRYHLIGAGIYNPPEAARLIGISSRSIRRWVFGYRYTVRGEHHYSPPVIEPQLGALNGATPLSFLDLQEIRFLRAFRSHGVSWHTLRRAEEEARRRTRRSHPFATGKFVSFRRDILMRVAASVDDPALESILNNQLLLGRLVASYAKGLEFQNGEVVRWYPTNDRRIVIDPERSFGQPIVAREGVPTLVLSKSFRVERSVARVARWYEVEIDSVRSAIDFEKTRQAA